MFPGSDTLIALSKALGVKTGFFYRQSQVKLTRLEFRKKSRFKKRDENRVKYQTLDFLERLIEIENVMGQQSLFKNPLQNTVIENQKDIENAAILLRKAWDLGIE